MRILCLILFFSSFAHAGEQAPVYWQFSGPLGPDIRQALAIVRTDDDAHHLILPDERDAYLAGVTIPTSFGCLEDSATCQSTHHGVLRALGFGAKVTASGKKSDDGFSVIFKMILVDGAQAQTFTGSGETLDAATQQAFGALHGQGTLALSVVPKDASFRLNNTPFGQGGGDYIIPAGRHTLLVEAPGFRSVEQPIQIQKAQKLRLKVELPIAFGKVSMKTNPPEASVYLDGTKWDTPGETREIEPGEHSIRVEAKGFVTFTKTFTVKPAVAHDLSLKLQPKDPPWRTALRTVHSDTQQTAWTVRGGLQFGGARGGEVNLETSRGRDLVSIDESAGIIGFDLALDWRSQHLMVTALQLSVQTGGGKAKAKLDGNINSELDTLSRTTIRAGWVGARYSMWRIDGYATFGLGLVMEDILGKTLTQEYEASATRPIMGNEFGLRYAFDGSWFAGVAASFEYWPGDRSASMFGINGGYAFNLPKGWF